MENRNNIFEESYQKAFLRPSFRVFGFLNLSSDSRYLQSVTLKVIPQKLKLPMNYFETFPECSLPSTVSKRTIKMRGHHSRLRDMMGQSYPIYACTRAI